MAGPNEVLELDAVAQAALVRSGDVSAADLVDAAIDAARRLNPQLNAIIHPRFERARAEADVAVTGDAPFGGVPIVIKDLGCAMAGEPMHLGSRLLKNAGYRADADSFLYRRLRRAGFVAIGRTNVPEFGTIISTESFAYGACRNPWNTDHSTGGSSGGSASAVAAGVVAVGHGGDGGGSIRIPASECGLVGLKPSRGRVSAGPVIGEAWAGSVTDGAVTRTVRDAAAVLDVMAGYEPGDPYAAPPFTRPLAAEVGVDPGRLRIGVWSGPTMDRAVHPECVAAVDRTGRLLESLGHHVEVAAPAALSDEQFGAAFSTVVMCSASADRRMLEQLFGRPVTADDFEPHNLLYSGLGDTVSAAQYIAALTAIHAWSRSMLSWWHPQDGSAGFDVLVTPTISQPPPPIGYIDPARPDVNDRVLELLLFTAQFNASGQPAVSLPLHWTADGLPVGVQVVGGFAAEPLLVRLAAQLEAAQPWSARRPAVWAGANPD